MRVGEKLDERCRITVSGGKVSSDVRGAMTMALSFVPAQGMRLQC
jgi:hypothetical protein